MNEIVGSGLHSIDFTLQLIIFLTITSCSFIVLAITFIAGAVMGTDHDVSHDHDLGRDHDISTHDGGGHESTISVFSPKIFFVFLAGFGAAGSIASIYKLGAVASSLWGLGSGVIFGLIAFATLSLLYKAQANSVVSTNDTIGKIGHVTTSISKGGGLGEVEVIVSGQSKTYMALSKSGEGIPRSKTVKVLAVQGATLVVDVVA